MRDSRQMAVLRSLFKTLHPTLTSGLKNGLAPAKRMLTGGYQNASNDSADHSQVDSHKGEPSKTAADAHQNASGTAQPKRAELPPLPRSLTDEHLIAELESATAQFDLQRDPQKDRDSNSRRPPKPAPSRRHFSRDSLLSHAFRYWRLS